MVSFWGFTCYDDCYCCNYHCNNECNYHFFEECYFSFKYISNIEDSCDCWCIILPCCVFPFVFDIISCPCRCCYQECYKKCSCTKINAVNAVNAVNVVNVQPGTTIINQSTIKINNNIKNDLLKLPPHYNDHYRDSTIVINTNEVLPPLYDN